MGLARGSWSVRRSLLAALLAGGLLGAGPLRSARAEEPPAPAAHPYEETTIEDFLKSVGRRLAARVAWDPSVKLIKDKKIVGAELRAEPGRLLALVRNTLVPYDLVMVPMGTPQERWYFVTDAKQQGAVLRLKPEAIELTDDNLARYEGEDGLFVTTTVRVRNLRNLRDARTALTKITTQNLGNITEVPDANAFVVTDFAPAAVAIYRTVRQLDVAPAVPSSPTRLVTLRHANADTVAKILNAHFAPASGSPRMPQQAGPMPEPPAPPRITPDGRTNQILLGGTTADVEAVLELIKGLDVPVKSDRVESAPATAPKTVHVLRLKHAEAMELSNVLQQVASHTPGWWTVDGGRPVLIPDPHRNALIVVASDEALTAVRALVETLDTAPAAPKEPPPAPAGR